jgi:hypothetical protein
MNHTRVTKILVVLFAVVLCFGTIGLASPIGTAFTYQGRLIDANNVADGLYDFQFKLFDANSDGNQEGADVNKPEVDVIDGYFTVELDFGSVFDGNAVWLDIGVRPGELEDPNAYTTLSPRQEVTPTPYALYALNGNGGGGADSDWIISGNDMYSGLSGNVGIGTTSPLEKLDVNGHISTAYTYKIGSHTVLTIPGTANTFVGNGAGELNSTGYYNTFTGYNAGFNNTTGHSNTFSGKEAGYANTTGYANTFLGDTAGRENTTANGNTFLGSLAGQYNTTGYYNTFSGLSAGRNNTTGYDNTFTGMSAGAYNTTGTGNTFLGYGAGLNSTVGSNNTFVGNIAGNPNKAGDENTCVGAFAGYSSDPNGSGNVFVGFAAGYGASGSNKLYIGNALFEPPLIYGDFSAGRVGIGTTSPAARLDIVGDINVATNYKIDGSAVLSIPEVNNTFIGLRAGYSNTTGYSNTFSGHEAGYSNSTGYRNTFSGYWAGRSSTTGWSNTFSGYRAGYSNTTGHDNTFSGNSAGCLNTTGYYNTFLGSGAGSSNTGGYFNTFLGVSAGISNIAGVCNTFLGVDAGALNTTGSGNVFIGHKAGYNETGSNKLYIDNSDTSTPLIYGDFLANHVGINRVPTANAFEVEGNASKTTAGSWLANSDARIKTDVQTITGALEVLDKVRLVSFKYNDDYRNEHSDVEDRRYLNVIAQEFRQVFPDYVKSSGEKLPNSEEILQVDTYPLTVYSAAAVQELHNIVKDKEAEIAQLKERVSKMETLIAKLLDEQKGGQR